MPTSTHIARKLELARLLSRQGDVVGARDILQIAANSSHPVLAAAGAYYLGSLALRHGETERAREAFQHAIEVSQSAKALDTGFFVHDPGLHQRPHTVLGGCWLPKVMWMGRATPTGARSTSATPSTRPWPHAALACFCGNRVMWMGRATPTGARSTSATLCTRPLQQTTWAWCWLSRVTWRTPVTPSSALSISTIPSTRLERNTTSGCWPGELQ
jgi:hypothetical protein